MLRRRRIWSWVEKQADSFWESCTYCGKTYLATRYSKAFDCEKCRKDVSLDTSTTEKEG